MSTKKHAVRRLPHCMRQGRHARRTLMPPLRLFLFCIAQMQYMQCSPLRPPAATSCAAEAGGRSLKNPAPVPEGRWWGGMSSLRHAKGKNPLHRTGDSSLFSEHAVIWRERTPLDSAVDSAIWWSGSVRLQSLRILCGLCGRMFLWPPHTAVCG